MSARAFGAAAHRVARRLSGPQPILVCEPAQAATALSAALELRRRGDHFVAAIVLDDEPARRSREHSAVACGHYPSLDEIRIALDAFTGLLDPRAILPLDDDVRVLLHEFVRLADLLVARSQAEADRVRRLLGAIPRPVEIVHGTPEAIAVPFGPPTDVVVYAPHERGDALGVYATALADLPLPVVFVAQDAPPVATHLPFVGPAQGPAALAQARLIVDASDDPATTIALARLGKPLVTGAHAGGAEFVTGVTTFEPWKRASIIAAVADALGGGLPAVREPAPATQPSLQPAVDRLEARRPRVSVIVTTYNRPAILAETLAAIERQTYPEIEIIVVNDAGTDVADVVARFPRATLLTHERNAGPAAARNTGLRAATGQYVLFFDDDDEMFPDHIGALAGAAVRSNLDVVYGQLINGFVTTGPDGRYQLHNVLPYEALLDHAEIQWGATLATTAVLFRRTLVHEIGEVDESLRANEDYEFWIRLAAGRAWARVPHVTSLYFVRSDGTNRSQQNARERYITAHRAIFAKHATERALILAGRQSTLTMFGAS